MRLGSTGKRAKRREIALSGALDRALCWELALWWSVVTWLERRAIPGSLSTAPAVTPR